jgi:uncharacterized protein YjbI with pentapeptide repeats
MYMARNTIDSDDKALRLNCVEAKGIDYSGRNLDQLLVTASVFRACDFRNMTITGGSFGTGKTPTLYLDCRFDSSKLRNINSGEARFERCTFTNCDIRNMINLNGEFVDCVFSGKLRGVTFRANPWTADGSKHPQRDRNEVSGNDFREADMHWVEFGDGIDLAQQKFPNEAGYLLILDLEKKIPALQHLFDTAAQAERKAVDRAIARLENIANLNNDQVFANLVDICDGDPELMRRFLEALG